MTLPLELAKQGESQLIIQKERSVWFLRYGKGSLVSKCILPKTLSLLNIIKQNSHQKQPISFWQIYSLPLSPSLFLCFFTTLACVVNTFSQVLPTSPNLSPMFAKSRHFSLRHILMIAHEFKSPTESWGPDANSSEQPFYTFFPRMADTFHPMEVLGLGFVYKHQRNDMCFHSYRALNWHPWK